MVRLKTPSRVHITLIDLNGRLGRVDGGVGLALEEPSMVVSAERARGLSVEGGQEERAREAARRMLSALGVEGGVRVRVESSYPPHIGLGSGTQLMLAVGKVIAELYGRKLSARRIAEIMGRGGTSGIGVAAFERGGFLLDGGHSMSEKKGFFPSSASRAPPAPLLARHRFPSWRIALVMPKGRVIQGAREVGIFQERCPIPVREVRKLSHLILMKMLPALVERDISSFGESVNAIQALGFKKIEVALQTERVRKLLRACQRHSYGAGLSSFGPSIYCLPYSEEELLNAVGREAKVVFTRANNQGARYL